MDEKLLVQVGAAVFVALAITATAIGLTRKPDQPTLLPTVSSGSSVSDGALHDELLRCQVLGNLPVPPKECLDAWSESRRRFLGGDLSTSLPVKTLPQTAPSVADASSAANPNATSQDTAPATSVPNPPASTDATQRSR